MEKKQLYKNAAAAVFWIVLLAIALTTATYAWFTFTPATNVEPMASTVSDGYSNLLIASDRGTEFSEECDLTAAGGSSVLTPVSSVNLNTFYQASIQNREGVALRYKDASSKVEQYTLHGRLYLQSMRGSCNVCFYRDGMNLGVDAQTLAALRLGMKITVGNEVRTYIFYLDELGVTDDALAVRTVEEADAVVSSIDVEGNPVYEKDPAESILNYTAQTDGTAGDAFLCTLAEGEIAEVEYWLYLEGCDEHCINEVQRRDAALQMAFIGLVPGEDET